jgi:tetratricopeptide (TPR) repeat protein
LVRQSKEAKRQGHDDKARAFLEEAVRLVIDSNSEDACRAITEEGIRSGLPQVVLPAADRAIEILPKYGLAYDTRGKARAASGNYMGAVEDFEFFLSKEPSPRVAALRRDWIARLKAGQALTAKELLAFEW